MSIQTIYQKTIKFAAKKHAKQTIPGTDLPYLVHLSNVAMEIFIAFEKSKNFDLEFAIRIALLHDTLEDTDTTFEELENLFGIKTRQAVEALTKNAVINKSERMNDSLKRIRKQPNEVWAVKLADRITNLQTPPHYWSEEKIKNYKNEAILILKELKGGNSYLEERLKEKIENYGR
ncbi:HD domain-containing protein [Chryseobacterium sp. Hurlbut01]|jgi:guanosine-3',5'-bis(diphosphate) 3'-pyrophosphohydrolase|uniref:HD domain-containing protein n=1 Tax=Chryseobacterium sp. Hurlbut01 TaxID=1681828 RepID=UPI00067B255D|nr:HD domain-containing protein [Chryseobacterium sp. Hurlbut01]KNB61132.1 guanosine polyphosphate pyrophosphohydrolase [Chryseobacterium sp. Hurlbut01]